MIYKRTESIWELDFKEGNFQEARQKAFEAEKGPAYAKTETLTAIGFLCLLEKTFDRKP